MTHISIKEKVMRELLGAGAPFKEVI